jgi:hypothetical protein
MQAGMHKGLIHITLEEQVEQVEQPLLRLLGAQAKEEVQAVVVLLLLLQNLHRQVLVMITGRVQQPTRIHSLAHQEVFIQF